MVYDIFDEMYTLNNRSDNVFLLRSTVLKEVEYLPELLSKEGLNNNII